MYRNILRCSTLFSHIFFVILMKDDDWSLGIILSLPTELKSGLLSKWLERHVCCSRTRLRPPRARERLSRTQGFLWARRAKVDKNLLGTIPRELSWFARRQKCDIKEHFAPARRGVFSKMTRRLNGIKKRLKGTAQWKREQAEQSIREKLKIQMFIFNKSGFSQQSSASRWNSSDQMTTRGKEDKNRRGRPTRDKFLLVFFWFQGRGSKRGHEVDEVQQT